MAHYGLTIPASNDLRQIARYTKETWRDDQAKKYCRELRNVLENLVETPRIGRCREELAPSLRSFQAGSYVVFYQESKTGVIIVRMLHSRRDVEKQLRG